MKLASLHISAKAPGLPRIKHLTVTRTGNGALVTHHFGGGFKPKQFSFANPAKMTMHLRRTLADEWQHPNADTEANRIEGELNI